MPAAKSLGTTKSQRYGRGSGGVTGKGFRPGVSGNPSGVSKESVDVIAYARIYTKEAVDALVAALKTPKERVSAAVAILNRAHGLPPTRIEGLTPQSITVLHLIAAKEIGDEIARALVANGDAAPTIDGEAANGEDVAPPDLYTPALE
jgi:hypothetical protein